MTTRLSWPWLTLFLKEFIWECCPLRTLLTPWPLYSWIRRKNPLVTSKLGLRQGSSIHEKILARVISIQWNSVVDDLYLPSVER